MIQHMLPGVDLYPEYPAQPLTTVGEELDYTCLDHDLSEVWCGAFMNRSDRC